MLVFVGRDLELLVQMVFVHVWHCEECSTWNTFV